jgi:hypothetical protein
MMTDTEKKNLTDLARTVIRLGSGNRRSLYKNKGMQSLAQGVIDLHNELQLMEIELRGMNAILEKHIKTLEDLTRNVQKAEPDKKVDS